MKFGCCVKTPTDVAILAEAGYDFCELPAAAVQPFETDADVQETLTILKQLPIPAEAFNLLVPRQLRLLGPEYDPAALRTYLQRAFTRMVAIGGQVAVLGSGGARNFPDDMARTDALDQLAVSLSLAGEEAARAGITLVLEPLNTRESNVFNTVTEAYNFIKNRKVPHMQVLADLHHMEMDDEPLANVVTAADMLRHVHVADGERKAPGSGGYNYPGFMQALRQAGYDTRISIECRWDDLATQAASSLKYLHQQWAASA